MKSPSYKQALLLMIIAPAMWSMAGVLTRHVDSNNGFEISFWRSFFTALFILFTLLWQHRSAALQKIVALGKYGLISSFMWAVMFACFMLALTMTTVANALIVISLSPLLTALLAFFFLKQHVPLRTWIAIVVAFFGMVWMFVDGFTQLDTRGFIGVMLAMCVPIATSVNFIVMKKGGAVVDLIPAILVGACICSLMMLPWALPLSASVHDIGILAFMGVFQLGLPCMLLVFAAKTLSAPEISLLCLIEVLLGPIWVWLAKGEIPANATILGGVIVLLALIVNELAALKMSTKNVHLK